MVKKIFPCFYYSSPLAKKGAKGFRQELLKEVRILQKSDENGKKWSEKNYWGGYTSYGSLDQLHRFSPTFEELHQKIRPHLKKFLQGLKWQARVEDLHLNSLWMNIMPTGTTHSFHLHPLSVISGTYYVQVPRDCSGLQFEDPKHGFQMAAPPKKKSTPLSEQPHYLHRPQEGDLVLFESWMKHQVPPNPSSQERISISFNFDWNPS